MKNSNITFLKTAIVYLSLIFLISLMTSCGVNWQISTYSHDPIYDDENYLVVADGVRVDTLNEFQFRNRLRTDFQFRYNFAQYAISQPRSFDWNNRLLGYRWNRNIWGYSYYSYWDRNQMWNDWAWGFTPHRWSPFGYDRWGYNSWMGNAHWGYGWSWNNYYGWNGWYDNTWGWRQQMNNYAWQHRRDRSNTVYVNSRRSSINNSIVSNRRVNVNTRVRVNTRTNTNIKPRVYVRPENNNSIIIRNNNTRTIRVKPVPPVIRHNNTNPNNSRPVRINPSRSTGTTTKTIRRNN